MIRLDWSDGSVTIADDADAALRQIGRTQWKPIKGPDSTDEVKVMLSDRAWAWSGTDVDYLLDSDTFLNRCADAHLFLLTRETTT